MSNVNRVFLIVLDSCGCGAAPDAAAFGDEGAHTLQTISRSPQFRVATLRSLGFSHIDGLGFLGDGPLRSEVARLRERSAGKDTTLGHWEIAGHVSDKPLPTFPDGFPQSFCDAFSTAVGRGLLCNKPYSGTEVIKDYGREHLATGKLIVYTSADSVLQIAAHEDLIPPEELYAICRTARAMLTGDLGVGRVIARPFTGEWPYTRTPRRHDFSIEPPADTMLDELKAAGYDVLGVGKIHDIFAGRGLTDFVYTTGNTDGMAQTSAYQQKDFHGLCFVNLVDFDMLYGHRRDVDGYAAAFAEFDGWLAGFIDAMRPDDVLMITADHGCDPAFHGTDHTREYVPFLTYGAAVAPRDRGTLDGFVHVAARVKELLEGETL
ncbi:MAG: phosphopentomutase [Clostridia bacterium]|nr:phosphopentomutase [Clostridia bacterium]